ncbi:MAG TPA: type II toxin-antitoxin system ParD family antitoxin [Phycisphaerales bacterium]|jgi:putative addiction module CopG family antidote|nr:type II toxin-antitoxin system ParD family antitoxin [Phycisphaerales bacterium]
MKSSKSIALTPKGQKAVRACLASGRYSSAQEVIEEALSLLDLTERQHRARLASIDAAIERGMADVRADRVVDFDDDAVARIKREGRALLARSRRKSA